MPTVWKAVLHGDMGSRGSASNKLIRQFKFPYEYDADEEMIQADHDRMLQWDHAHASAAFSRHMGTGELGLAQWAKSAGNEQVLLLLKDLFKVDENHPGVEWTGYRITGTVNQSNGYPVYSLWLFAKKQGSETKVYSGSHAPNVEDGDSKGRNIFGAFDDG